ncbi:hypothetical protein [Absidia glauca]|uniref:Uncharacterized protein n=1 Tax=Absidia glauca TaxID=4829 RepID=A0A168TBK3_ABSGL|nr:hypothetical protein [Absidia glauca]
MVRNDKAVEFNKLKRKLDNLTEEHRMLISYLGMIEDAVIQEFRQYMNPTLTKRQCCIASSRRSHPYMKSLAQRSRRPYMLGSVAPLSPPASSVSQTSSPASSPLLTPMYERLPSLISPHST